MNDHPTPPTGLRPEVLAFAHLMEQKLRENDYKDGWHGCGEEYLEERLEQEMKEFLEAYDKYETAPDLAPREAADVANFLMMLIDIRGYLPKAPESDLLTKARAVVDIEMRSEIPPHHPSCKSHETPGTDRTCDCGNREMSDAIDALREVVGEA